jgi:adenosylmethionine-8-amino-7-oxononanoate aminotransferase
LSRTYADPNGERWRQQATDNLWMPYSPPGAQGSVRDDIRVMTRGRGVLIWDADGREYLDGTSALEALILGHGDEALVEAIAEQARTMSFVDVFRFVTPPKRSWQPNSWRRRQAWPWPISRPAARRPMRWHTPDFITISKALSSGYVPIGATLISPSVRDTFIEHDGVFPHGHKYAGHPIAAAAALSVSDPLAAGDRLRIAAREHGLTTLLLHPGNVLLVAPAVVATEADIDRIVEILDAAMGDLDGMVQ